MYPPVAPLCCAHDRDRDDGLEGGMNVPEEGKEFSPEEKVADEEQAEVTEGSGKQFAPGAEDPETDPKAQRQRGSGKEFAPPVKDPNGKGTGTGKEFARGQQSGEDLDED